MQLDILRKKGGLSKNRLLSEQRISVEIQSHRDQRSLCPIISGTLSSKYFNAIKEFNIFLWMSYASEDNETQFTPKIQSQGSIFI